MKQFRENSGLALSYSRKSQATLTRLQQHLRQYRSAVVALSGGVDSTLLALVTHQALPKGKVHAITGVSSSLPAKSLESIRDFCKNHQIQLHQVQTDELNNERYVRNAPDRCFHCKSELYSKLLEKAQTLNAEVILDGTHPEDLRGHRPGHQAAVQLKIKSPFLDLNITKEDIRAVATMLGLQNADAPSSPCLSSRVAYGVTVTPARLHKIEQGEAFLQQLGFDKVRVRLHGATARIEVPANDIEKIARHHASVAQEFRRIGFTYVTLDLEGYRSGSLLRVIETPHSP